MSMMIDNVDFCDPTHWYDRFFDSILDTCREELWSGSSAYQEIEAKCNEILERYGNVDLVVDRSTVKKPITFSEDELAALSQYQKLDSDSKELEAVQMYLLGCRHTLQMLQFLEMI